MTNEEKLLAGARLFDMACQVTLAGIRDEQPELSEEQALEILRERLRQARQREFARQPRSA